MILAHLSDLHVRPPGLPANRVIESTLLAERALRAVARLQPQPDAVLITGDLTDCGLPAEYEVLAGLLRRHLGHLRVLLLPGNHDRRGNFRAALGAWPGVTSHPEFVQYVVDDLPVRLVVLDSVAEGFGHGELCQARLSWLEQTLAEAPTRVTMVAMHHPPINVGLRLSDAIALQAPEGLAAILRRHNQVERILCGHVHRTISGRLGTALVCIAPSVAHQSEFDLVDDQGRLVLEPPGYLVHVGHSDSAFVSHHVYVETFPGPYPYIADPDYPGRRA